MAGAKDADGVTMREAMQHAGLRLDDIAKLQRDPAQYLGFIEVHIEQGPVLSELDLPWAWSPPSTAACATCAK